MWIYFLPFFARFMYLIARLYLQYYFSMRFVKVVEIVEVHILVLRHDQPKQIIKLSWYNIVILKKSQSLEY